MESSKNFDIPPVLKPDVERRLLRVFAFLRQHDRKTKLAKKTAELSTVKDQSKRAAAAAPVAKSVEERDLLEQELFGNQRADSSSVANPEAHMAVDPSVDKTRDTVVSILENEIEELQRTINFKDFDTSGSISAADLSSAFRALNRPTPKAEVQWMIWEADDDLDGSIDWDEFRGAYARCVVDKQGMEPSQLFHFIHFLLSDPDGGGSVSVADVRAELQRIRGTDYMANKIKKALGAITDQQEQQRHPLEHYLNAVLTQLPTSFASGNHFPPKQ